MWIPRCLLGLHECWPLVWVEVTKAEWDGNCSYEASNDAQGHCYRNGDAAHAGMKANEAKELRRRG